MTVICTICARGGSKGVPRKNVKPLMGKPLIAHTIEQALACPEIERVFVSTDDQEIADVAQQYGAEVPFLRPAEMATSKAPKIPVIEHLVEEVEKLGVEVTTIVDLDPTSPLRSQADIKGAYDLLDDETDVVITGYHSDKNQYFNMVEAQPDGTAILSKSQDHHVTSRQEAPAVFSMNGSVYVWHRETLVKGLWDGRAKLFEMPRTRSVDIDSPLDIAIVEMLMSGEFEEE